jgi:hypothetical protein
MEARQCSGQLLFEDDWIDGAKGEGAAANARPRYVA